MRGEEREVESEDTFVELVRPSVFTWGLQLDLRLSPSQGKCFYLLSHLTDYSYTCLIMELRGKEDSLRTTHGIVLEN